MRGEITGAVPHAIFGVHQVPWMGAGGPGIRGRRGQLRHARPDGNPQRKILIRLTNVLDRSHHPDNHCGYTIAQCEHRGGRGFFLRQAL